MIKLPPGSELLPKAPSDSTQPPASEVRYRVLGLSFLMAFMMYMERGAIGAAAPSIMREFHVDRISMGWAVSAFNWSYALFQVPAGWMADRFGPRIILAAAMAWWSIFTAATGFTFSASSLAATRFLFGIGEAGAFPAGSRALVRWLPVRRRAFGQGFQHSGSRLGAALAPALVVALTALSGWRPVFYLFGVVGIVWAVVWYAYYRDLPFDHPGINAAELAIINPRPHDSLDYGATAGPVFAPVPSRVQGALHQPAEELIRPVEDLGTAGSSIPPAVRPAVPWGRILRSRDLWYLSTIYFCYGWVLWLYLAWFPTYLREARHFTSLGSASASLPLLAATVTNVAGGLLSDRLAHQWNDLRRGRLIVSMGGFAIAGIALLPGVLAPSAVAAMVCLTVALAGLELTVSVSWAICIDIGGDFSGSVSSVMNTWGNMGGAVSAVMVGYLATLLGWTSPFLLASALCLFSALLVSRIDPRRPGAGEPFKT